MGTNEIRVVDLVMTGYVGFLLGCFVGAFFWPKINGVEDTKKQLKDKQ